MDEPVIAVHDDPERHAYIVTVDGAEAGKTVYHMRGGRHIFVHTEVDDAYAGKGIGTKLVKTALDEVRGRGGTIVAICPFVSAYLRRHPDYDDMIDHELSERIERKGQPA